MRKLARRLPRELLEIDKAIVDTSLLLPYVGLKVRGLSEEAMKTISEMELYYPSIMIAELIGVMMREARRAGLSSIPKIALRNFNSIIYGEAIRIISPIDQDLEIAYTLITSGLNDIFDAILYSTSRRTGIKAITMDKALIEFLQQRNFNISNLILLT